MAENNHRQLFSANRETVEDWENGQELVRFLDQLDIFESCGKKAEIESLESILNGQLRGNYLTKMYLPLSMDTYINSKRPKSIQNQPKPVSTTNSMPQQNLYSTISPFSSQQTDSGLESQHYSQHFSPSTFIQPQSHRVNRYSQQNYSQPEHRRSLHPYSRGQSQGYASQTLNQTASWVDRL